jgi:low affinity Fe/Cu permease
MSSGEPTSPSEVTEDRGWFDHLADRVSTIAASSWFFVTLIALALIWLALGPLTDFSHHWIDVLEVVVAILTLLLVAVLENEQWRNAKATQRKLNAIAAALAHLMESDDEDSEHIRELQAAVGLEKRESVSD